VGRFIDDINFEAIKIGIARDDMAEKEAIALLFQNPALSLQSNG